MLSDGDRRKAQSFAADCADALGEALVAAYLHGAQGQALLLVVDEVTLDVLDRLGGVLRGWKGSVAAAPLVLEAGYLAGSCDVFPLEMLELLQTRSRLLGDIDPLAELAINREHLRLEVEQQLKGKLLHLRQAYLETGGARAGLAGLMIDSSEGFELIMRGLVELAGGDHSADVCSEVERLLGIRLEVFHAAQEARRARRSTLAGSPRDLFAAYLDELAALAKISDGLTHA